MNIPFNNLPPGLKTRCQGYSGIALAVFLATLLPAVVSFGRGHFFAGGVVFFVGLIPAALLFLIARSMPARPQGEWSGVVDEVEESLMLRIARIGACFVASIFISLVGLWVACAGIYAVVAGATGIGLGAVALIFGSPYLLAWIWVLYLSFPRFKSFLARVIFAVLLAALSVLFMPLNMWVMLILMGGPKP